MPRQNAPLTDIQVNKAKRREKEYKLSDGGGLHLLVTKTGGKLWRLQYRFNGKQKLLALGQYPAVSLADARQRREEAKKLLANGQDPSAVKKYQQEAAQYQQESDANTFEKVAREWHEQKKPEWSTNHADRLLVRLEQDVFPQIGSKPIADIKTPELVQLLQRIATRTIETAYRVKMALGMICQYAVLKGLTDTNPAASLRGVLPARRHKHMAAPTEPKDVAALMRAIEGFTGTYVVQCALKCVFRRIRPAFRCESGRRSGLIPAAVPVGKRPVVERALGQVVLLCHRDLCCPVCPEMRIPANSASIPLRKRPPFRFDSGRCSGGKAASC